MQFQDDTREFRPLRQERQRLWRFAIISAAILFAGLGQRAQAQPPGQAPEIGLRVYRQLFEEWTQRDIDRVTGIRTSFNGAAVSGSATTRGDVNLEVTDSRTFQVLEVNVQGQSIARTTSAKRSARVHSLSITDFTAIIPIGFRDEQFYMMDPEVGLNVRVIPQGVSSTRRGCLGRIVRRVASRKAAEQRGASLQFARQQAHNRVVESCRLHVGELVERLNGMVQFRETIKAVGPNREELEIRLDISEEFFTILAFTKGKLPAEPPSPSTVVDAPVELWIHVGVEEPILEDLAKLWSGSRKLMSWLREKLATPLPEGINLQFDTEGDWVRLNVGRYEVLPPDKP